MFHQEKKTRTVLLAAAAPLVIACVAYLLISQLAFVLIAITVFIMIGASIAGISLFAETQQNKRWFAASLVSYGSLYWIILLWYPLPQSLYYLPLCYYLISLPILAFLFEPLFHHGNMRRVLLVAIFFAINLALPFALAYSPG